MILIKLFSKKLELFFLIFLLISYPAYAGGRVGNDCDFNFKVFEKGIIKQIPPSMVLSGKSDWINGERQLKMEGAETFILNYTACNHLRVSIKVGHVKLMYLEKILNFTRPLILQVAPGMAAIFNNLKSYMANTILNLEIRSNYFSTLNIEQLIMTMEP